MNHAINCQRYIFVGGGIQLGEQQEKQRSASAPAPMLREVGPLEQQAIETHKRNVERQAPVVVSKEEQEQERKVQQILNDRELSTLLMDPAVQTLIQDCGDARKFQQHMRDPRSAAILQKLMNAGLVQIAR